MSSKNPHSEKGYSMSSDEDGPMYDKFLGNDDELKNYISEFLDAITQDELGGEDELIQEYLGTSLDEDGTEFVPKEAFESQDTYDTAVNHVLDVLEDMLEERRSQVTAPEVAEPTEPAAPSLDEEPEVKLSDEDKKEPKAEPKAEPKEEPKPKNALAKRISEMR
jgi:hypothetical protein